MFSLEKVSILLVDDDQKNIDVVQETLSREGLQIIATTSGLEALELFTQERFTLSILDVHMPEMDGFEIFQRFLDINMVPCIFITADRSKELKLKAMDIGATSLLYKPLSVNLLRYTVQKIIEVL